MLRRMVAPVLVTLAAACCIRPDAPNLEGDRVAIETLLRQWPRAIAAYDWNSASAMVDEGAQWIEDGPPTPITDFLYSLRKHESLNIGIKYGDLRKLQVYVKGDVAWAHWLIDGTFTADTDAGRAWFRGLTGTKDTTQREWHYRWVESAVLKRISGKWYFVLGHTTSLPEPLPH